MKTSFLPVAMAPVPLLSTSFLLVNIFALIFLYFASILNTKTKYILFVMTATVSFNVKSLFKNNYEKTSSRIATFIISLNICTFLMMLKSELSKTTDIFL